MTQWIIDIITAGGYWGIAFLMAVENIFPPIPSEVIMGLGGVAVARGQMSIVPLMIAGTLGSTLGNYFWFEVGRRLGYERLQPFIVRFGRWLTLEWRDVERAVKFFQSHGQWVVCILRFSPFLRTMISLPAGLSRMSTWRFLVFTTIGAAVWNIVLVLGGYYLGVHFADELDRYMGPAVAVATAIFIAFYIWRVATWRPSK